MNYENQNGDPCPPKKNNPCPPMPRDNDGNIVNINGGCCESKETQPKNYVFYEKETPSKCCSFQVYITRFWVVSNKDVDPKAGIILQGYANEQSGVAPGLGTYLHAHPKHGWINLNQKIGTFQVKEGEKFPVLLRADAIEWGQGLDGASDVGSDKEPEQDGTQIILDCSTNKVATTQLSVKLQRPRGGEAGRVAIEFAAFKVSCCC